MGRSYDYSYQSDGKHALAQVHDIDASFKDLAMVCANIRRKRVKTAQALLEKAEKKEIPIRFYKYSKHLGHRSELGGKKGRYPVKAVKIVKKVFENAVANAEFKGLDLEKMVVVHASANKHKIYPRMQFQGKDPRGRAKRSDVEHAKVEICLEEKTFSMNVAKKVFIPKLEKSVSSEKTSEKK